MTKITYLLGAGASYYSCPIWKEQAKAMQTIGDKELYKTLTPQEKKVSFYFTDTEELNRLTSNKQIILWYISFFGKRGEKFNTIDTYARKLYLQKEFSLLNLLKMSVSVFFDLWENFYNEQFAQNSPLKKGEHPNENVLYEKIDSRYISLLSVFLENTSEGIKLNNDISFITWNYDLQLEGAYKMFIEKDREISFEEVDRSFPFIENLTNNNNVFHLNGHRGFYKTKDSILLLRDFENYNDYWNRIDHLYDSVKRGAVTFINQIKYAWEHESNPVWYKKVEEIFNDTEVLIIIGYSFPLFNRRIDLKLFSNLDCNKLKEIVYQDPKGNEELINSILKNPKYFKNSIKVLKNSEQFYIPNTHFANEKDSETEIYI
jgi:hypothetical protein